MNRKYAKKKKPLTLTITVQRMENETIYYYLTDDRSRTLYDFVCPPNNPVDINQLQIHGKYVVHTAIDMYGSYKWWKVDCLYEPRPTISVPKPKLSLVDQLFTF